MVPAGMDSDREDVGRIDPICVTHLKARLTINYYSLG